MWKEYDLGERLEPVQVFSIQEFSKQVDLTVSVLAIFTNSLKQGVSKVRVNDVFLESL